MIGSSPTKTAADIDRANINDMRPYATPPDDPAATPATPAWFLSPPDDEEDAFLQQEARQVADKLVAASDGHILHLQTALEEANRLNTRLENRANSNASLINRQTSELNEVKRRSVMLEDDVQDLNERIEDLKEQIPFSSVSDIRSSPIQPSKGFVFHEPLRRFLPVEKLIEDRQKREQRSKKRRVETPPPAVHSKRSHNAATQSSGNNEGLDHEESIFIDEDDRVARQSIPVRPVVCKAPNETWNTIEMTAISKELFDEIRAREQYWSKEWSKRHTAKDVKNLNISQIYDYVFAQTANKCMEHRVMGTGSSKWTKVSPAEYACRRCANQQRLCFRVMEDHLLLLPLPPGVRQTEDARTVSYYRREGKDLPSLNRAPELWGLWE